MNDDNVGFVTRLILFGLWGLGIGVALALAVLAMGG